MGVGKPGYNPSVVAFPCFVAACKSREKLIFVSNRLRFLVEKKNTPTGNVLEAKNSYSLSPSKII
jgi:hypothetical protein